MQNIRNTFDGNRKMEKGTVELFSEGLEANWMVRIFDCKIFIQFFFRCNGILSLSLAFWSLASVLLISTDSKQAIFSVMRWLREESGSKSASSYFTAYWQTVADVVVSLRNYVWSFCSLHQPIMNALSNGLSLPHLVKIRFVWNLFDWARRQLRNC